MVSDAQGWETHTDPGEGQSDDSTIGRATKSKVEKVPLRAGPQQHGEPHPPFMGDKG